MNWRFTSGRGGNLHLAVYRIITGIQSLHHQLDRFLISESYLGSAIYFATDLEERPELLRPLLAAITSAFTRGRVTRFQGMLRRSDKFSRVIKLTPTSLAQIEVDLRAGVFDSLHFHERTRDEQDRGVPGLSILFSIMHPRAAQAFPYTVEITAPISQIGSTSDLSIGFSNAVSLLEGPYAFICPGNSNHDVQEEVSAIRIRPWTGTWVPPEEEPAPVRARIERLDSFQVARPILGSKMRGAYWGNFLGKDIVEQLGGSELVKKAAPAAEIREIDGGGLYLQCLPDLEFGTATSNDALAALQSFLRPVTI